MSSFFEDYSVLLRAVIPTIANPKNLSSLFQTHAIFTLKTHYFKHYISPKDEHILLCNNTHTAVIKHRHCAMMHMQKKRILKSQSRISF